MWMRIVTAALGWVLVAAPLQANPDTGVVFGSGPHTLRVLNNDPSGAKLASVAAPLKGNAKLGQGTVIYTAPSGFSGTDSFTYRANTSAGTAYSAKVTLTVVKNDARGKLRQRLAFDAPHRSRYYRFLGEDVAGKTSDVEKGRLLAVALSDPLYRQRLALNPPLAAEFEQSLSGATLANPDAAAETLLAPLASLRSADAWFDRRLAVALSAAQESGPVDLYVYLGDELLQGVTKAGPFNGSETAVQNALATQTDRAVRVLNCAVSGTSIVQWSSLEPPENRTPAWLNAPRRLRLSDDCMGVIDGILARGAEGTRLRAVVVGLGRTDALLRVSKSRTTLVSAWLDELRRTVELYRGSYGQEVQVLQVGLPDSNATGALGDAWRGIQSRQSQFRTWNYRLVQTAGLETYVDATGMPLLTGAGQQALGERLVEALLSPENPELGSAGSCSPATPCFPGTVFRVEPGICAITSQLRPALDQRILCDQHGNSLHVMAAACPECIDVSAVAKGLGVGVATAEVPADFAAAVHNVHTVGGVLVDVLRYNEPRTDQEPRACGAWSRESSGMVLDPGTYTWGLRSAKAESCQGTDKSGCGLLLTPTTAQLQTLSLSIAPVAGSCLSLPANTDSGDTSQPLDTEAFFAEKISGPVIDNRCTLCHVANGVAGTTRLLFRTSATTGHVDVNYQSLRQFVTGVSGGGDLLLTKVRGGAAHGGGVQLPATTQAYADLEQLVQALDTSAGSADTGVGIFQDVAMASRERTLRRAAILLAGRVPTDEELATVSAGDDAVLRRSLRGLMTGEGFHRFLREGANDRLLTDKFADGTPILSRTTVALTAYNRKAYAAFSSGLPQVESEFGRWEFQLHYGIARGPTELIAHVVEKDKPYTEILTADYAMVNAAANEAFGGNVTFEDPDDGDEFRVGRINEYVLRSVDLEDDCVTQACTLVSGGIPVDYPHAGVLNTFAFLARYPTTATNRNRARARWTYYHFLGVDIEKSGKRTSDPVALADTDNPTMKNPACTGCHSVMDPVAGAFQFHGETNHYKSEYGGLDSLPGLYKNPPPEIIGYASPGGGPTGLLFILQFNAGNWAYDEGEGIVQSPESFPTPRAGRAATMRFEVRDRRAKVFFDGESDARSEFVIPEHLSDRFSRGLVGIAHGGGEFPEQASTVERVRVWRDSGGASELVFDDDLADGASDLWQANCQDGSQPRDPGFELGRCLTMLRIDELPNVGKLSDFTMEVRYSKLGPGSQVWLRADPHRSLYRQGDTWFRDMRKTGFGAQVASGDPMQWLARQIVADPRFADASVRFWWPAVMGIPAAEAPANPADFDYADRLAVFEAQDADIRALADSFRSGFSGGASYNLKDLLVEMMMSPWFRAEYPTSTLSASTERRLAAVGIPRLLTPGQLERKLHALTGIGWGEYDRGAGIRRSRFADNEVNLGGIDSVGVIQRATELNAIISKVATSAAVEMACPVLVTELRRPDASRKFLSGISELDTPLSVARGSFPVIPAEAVTAENYVLPAKLPDGDYRLRVGFQNDYAGDGDRNLHIVSVRLRDASGAVVQDVNLPALSTVPGAIADNVGAASGEGWFFWSTGGVEVPLTVAGAEVVSVEVLAWGDQAGPEAPILDVSVRASDESTVETPGAKRIRAALRKMHWLFLGQRLAPDSPELDRSFDLLRTIWSRRTAQGRPPYLTTQFNGTSNSCNFELQRAEWSDPVQMKNTWMAMLVYMMIDYRYLHE